MPPGYPPGYGAPPEHPAVFRQQIDGLQRELRALKGDLDQVLEERSAMNRALQKPKFIEDIPGPRQPYTYVVKVPFTAGDTTSVSRGVTIAADGPFVCTAMRAFWRITTTGQALTGRWNPVSTLPYRIHSAATGPPAGQAEFSFRITTGGSGRFWQSDWLPGPIFDGMGMGRPDYQGIAGWVERTNTLTVEANPEFAIPASSTGDVWIYFEGYQVLIPISLSEQFGWTV